MKRKIKIVKEKVEKRLRKHLGRKEKSQLLAEIKRITFAGGKRLRPALFYYAYQACGGKNERMAVDMGVALELFHTFALIHDDILDKSDLRRGKATVHKKIGTSGAILAGDLCLTLANDLFYKTLLNTGLDFIVLKKTLENWQRMQEEICLGEYLDVSLSVNYNSEEVEPLRGSTSEKVWKVMEYKTGRYTIERPLHLAASLADAPKEIFTAFSKYGRNLGIAFQIKDDILGMFGEEKIIGKPADSDLKEGKMTLLMVRLLKKLKQQKLEKDLTWVRQKMKTLGVLRECEDLAGKLVKKAKKAIKNSSLKQKDKEFFLQLSDYVVERKY